MSRNDFVPLSTHRLLLLDDEPEAHLLTAAILAQLDEPKWTMDSAHSCEEALERAASGGYDLFLVDYYLENETGLDFLRAARERGTKAPMIMLTAHGDRDLDLHAMEAGASDYLVKGELDPRSLDRSIRYVLERQRTYDRLLHQEEELQRARKMEALARLAGGIAHDFNNLLTAMDGYTQMAMESLTTQDPARADLSEVRNAVTRAASLTERLLTLSRMQIVRPRPFDLAAALVALESEARDGSRERIRLSVGMPDGPLPVEADPDQVQQALSSLLANALEAMPDGGQLEVRANNVQLSETVDGLAPGSYRAVHLTDTGPGMDEETLAQAVEPFFSRKDSAKHAGLGLATAYAIARRSLGTIVLESGPGGGTTASLYLPATSTSVPAPSPERWAADSSVDVETILVAEAQDVVRRLVQRILERAGYRVLTAVNGPDAIRQAAAFPDEIHLLLTDVLMPAMSGRELADRLLVDRPGTKVLYISGYNEEQAGISETTASGVPFLQKPFAPEALELEVRSLLGS